MFIIYIYIIYIYVCDHHYMIIIYYHYVFSVCKIMAKNIGTLGKYDQRMLWKCICIVNPFDLLLKMIHKI